MNLIGDNFFWVLFLAGFNLLLAISGYIADKVNGPEGDRESPLGGKLCQRKSPADAGTVNRARQNKMSPSV